MTGRHVYMGLAAFYLIHDQMDDSFNLPRDSNDVALILQDRLFDSQGAFVYPLTDTTIRPV